MPTVSLSAAPSSLTEGGSTSTITVSLSKAASEATTVTLDAAGDDDAFDLSASFVTIPSGSTTGSVTLTPSQDSDFADESVVVSIVSVSGGGGETEDGTQSVTITIDDDDVPLVTLTVAPRALLEGDQATVTVRLSGSTGTDTRVSLAARGGTASLGASTVTVVAGATTATTVLTATQDADFDDESVTVSITNVSGGGELSKTEFSRPPSRSPTTTCPA